MTKRNAQLFWEIAAKIDEFPDNYDQALWIHCEDPEAKWPNIEQQATMLVEGACGTTACIAGWAVALRWKKGRTNKVLSWEDEARELLGLTEIEADDLFNPSWEPEDGRSVGDALRAIGAGAMISPPEEEG